ncbi:MAG: transcriptional regulator PpsR [Parvularcula sp.]|nr:transcriptional regulator PpsR [Parvularcula sp.]
MARPIAVRTTSFRDPSRHFAEIDAGLAAQLVSSGVDVALVIQDGVIVDLALGSPDLVEAGCDEAWRGENWRDTVTPDSHPKLADLLNPDLEQQGRWRQITQLALSGAPIPIRYTTVKTGREGHVLALGRDLRSIATLQQRLIAMHQDLEREYANLRGIESRYRSLFNALSETIVIVSGRDGTVSEMNPQAQRRLGIDADPRGRPFLDYVAETDRGAVQRMIDRAVSGGQGEAADVAFRGPGAGTMRATAFRQESGVYVIVRVEPDGTPPPEDRTSVAASDIQQVMSHLPDALVITTSTLRILSANATFLRMVQAVEDRQVFGQNLSTWLGRSNAEINMLQSSLKRHGVARNFATEVRDRFDGIDEVEVSAVAAEIDGETVYGFAIRPVSRRLATSEASSEWLAGRQEELTNLVGQMPLKDIVRASTDIIEKVCIETALKLSDDSRASAAELLGLSRQGLYSKLKRFKISDPS